MNVPAEQVKLLRQETGAGVLDCRKALESSGGDFDKAVALLREKGLAAAAKRADRETREGVLDLYCHGDGRVGVMVEVNCETDFVARTQEFRTFAHEVALQIAANSPRWVDVADIPAEVVDHDRHDGREDQHPALHALDRRRGGRVEARANPVLARILDGQWRSGGIGRLAVGEKPATSR
jgi:elongation factor Ts